MDRIDRKVIMEIALEAGWVEVPCDAYTLSFQKYNNGEKVRINVWPRRANVGAQSGRKQVYKRNCSVDFLEKLFNNEDLSGETGIKVIVGK